MEKLDSYIRDAKSIGIAGHIRPDGDCLGSSLALYGYIKKNYKDIEVNLYLDEFSQRFKKLPFADEILFERDDKKFDLFISIDVSEKSRLGASVKYFDSAKRTLCIDHHISNEGFADDNVIYPKASSASEVLFGMLDESKLDKELAICIYTGIIYDSGVFKHSNTSENTMKVAGKLLNYDIPFSKIIDESFYAKTYNQNLILGEALLSSKLFLDGKAIYTLVTRKQMDKYGLMSKDLDGIVDQLRITVGVECAVFINEIIPGEYKLSMRSNSNIDVNAVASCFGGGGHVKAAGCTIKANVEDIIDLISVEIGKQL